MMGHQETLSVQEVSFGYRNHPVLQKVSFSLAPKDFLCLLGPNGVGKSTLFRCILESIPVIRAIFSWEIKICAP